MRKLGPRSSSYTTMVDVKTGKCFICEVKNRSAETLIPIIYQCVEVFSTITSDQWPAYNQINKELYFHQTVNHSKNFVDPNSGAHTQMVESYWNSCKQWF